MLRVAIVGISGYGAILTDLLRKFAAQNKIFFSAAAVINRAQERERCRILEAENVRIFGSHREMFSALASEIDLCVVPVGIPWHAVIAVDALKAGCHVFLEKPIAGSYVDAAKICKAAKGGERHLVIGFQDLSDPGVWKIKDALLSGGIGEILEIRAAGAWPRSLQYFQRNVWAGKLIFDGISVRDSPHNNALAHLVNLSFFWAGKTHGASAWPRAVHGRLYRFLPIESFDTGWIQWDIDDGPRVICAASHSSEQVLPPQIFIQGTSGSLLWDYERGLLESGGLTLDGPFRPDVPALRELALVAAFKVAAGKTAYYCSAENALAHAKAMDMVHACLPIQSNMTAEVLVDYREGGEYHFVRGMEMWCRSALRPSVSPEMAEGYLRSQGHLHSAIN